MNYLPLFGCATAELKKARCKIPIKLPSVDNIPRVCVFLKAHVLKAEVNFNLW